MLRFTIAMVITLAGCGRTTYSSAQGGAAGMTDAGEIGGAGGSAGLAGAAGYMGFQSCEFTELQIGGTACALATDGRVACWGGPLGSVGNGYPGPFALPAEVSGITTARSIGGGSSHVCAALEGGTIACWGSNSRGQLGNGGVEDSYVPMQVANLTDAKMLAKGDAAEHTCALRTNGRISCWGAGDSGALGSGFASSEIPVEVLGISDAVDVAVGPQHTCAVHADGHVSCWGHTASALGLGYDNDNGKIYPSPQQVTLIDDAVQVAVGNYFACALRSAGAVWCWGHGNLGQLGDGNFVDSQPTPSPVFGLEDAVKISASDESVCALRKTGGVACWGRGLSIPGSGFTGVDTPLDLAGIDDATAIGAGPFIGCAVTESRGLVCWGDGYLGDGSERESESPVAVACSSGCAGTDSKQVFEHFTQCSNGDVAQTSYTPGLTCAKVCCAAGHAMCWGTWSAHGGFGCDAYGSSASCGEVFDDEHGYACTCGN